MVTYSQFTIGEHPEGGYIVLMDGLPLDGQPDMNRVEAEKLHAVAVLAAAGQVDAQDTLERMGVGEPIIPVDNAPTTIEAKVGDRVELAPHTDAWMSGDRYGKVSALRGGRVVVEMDRSGSTLRVTPSAVGRVVA